MTVHEPIDNVHSTNQLLYYSSPKTSEDAHAFMALQKILLGELKNSEKNPGCTVDGDVYDNNLYFSMKAFGTYSQEKSHMSIHAHRVKILLKITNQLTIYF